MGKRFFNYVKFLYVEDSTIFLEMETDLGQVMFGVSLPEAMTLVPIDKYKPAKRKP